MTIQISVGNKIQRVIPPTALVLNNANPSGYLYLSGDSVTPGSVREFYDGTSYILQKLINGTWTDLHQANENGTIVIKSVKTGVGSFHLGDLHQMSSAGENVIFKNNLTNTVWFPLWQGVAADGSSNIEPQSRNYTSGLVTVTNGSPSNTGAITSQFMHTAPENHSIYTVTVQAAETWSGNVTFYGYFGAMNIVAMDRTISAVTGQNLTLYLDYPIDLRMGETVTVFIQKQDGSFTNLALRPIFADMVSVWYSAQLKAFSDAGVTSEDDLDNLATLNSPQFYLGAGQTNIASFGTSLYAGWNWFIPVVITNPVSNGTLTNYPVQIPFNTLYPISSGKMQSAGQDIRFMDSTGLVPIQYYIQGDMNDFLTPLWVKIPSLPVGTTTIYILYGNSTATDAQGPPLTTGGAPIQPSVYIQPSEEDVYVPVNISPNVTVTTTGVQANGSQLVAYKGTWNANTNTPAIPTASNGNQGNYYVVSVAGTATIGINSDWGVGDWLVSNGTSWDRIPQQITVITDSVDFNTLTAPGMWASDIAPSANYPNPALAPATWRMWVIVTATKTYQWVYGTSGTHLRNYNGSVWSAWIQTDKDTPITIVAAGATAITPVPGLTLVNPSTGTGTVNLPTITQYLDGKVFYIKKSDTTNSTTLTINGNIDGVSSTSVSTHVPLTSYTLVADFTRNMYWIV